MNQPVATQRARFSLIDIYRGLALFGLLMVHLSDRFGVVSTVQESGTISTIVHLLFAGKAYGMLALCFGINFYILTENARKRGTPVVADQIWRYTLLFGFGLFNTMIFGGDVLQVIALLAFALILINRIKSNTMLLLVAVICFLQPYIWFGIISGLVAPEFASTYLLPSSTFILPVQEAVQETYKQGSIWHVFEMNLTEGSLAKWWYQLSVGRIFKSLGFFILGVYLGRTGFLQNPLAYMWKYKGVLIGLFATLPILGAAKVFFSDVAGPDVLPALLMIKVMSSSYFSLVVLLLALPVVTWLYIRFPLKLYKPLESAGRMTLTLYIMQSIVWVPVFYGFGLSGYATLPIGPILLIGLAFFALQVAFAEFWLRRFEYGPLESLWRRAIRHRPRRLTRIQFRSAASSDFQARPYLPRERK